MQRQRNVCTKNAEFFTKDAEAEERLHEERLNQQINQFQYARAITRISPATLLEQLIESFAGTGFERYLQFVKNVQRYGRIARQFRHLFKGSSLTPIEPIRRVSISLVFATVCLRNLSVDWREAIPKFKDTLSLSQDFNTAAVDLLLLTLFVIVLLSGAYLAFVRVEV